MADAFAVDVEIASYGHGRRDVEAVVVSLQMVRDAVGQCYGVVFRSQPVALRGHVGQRLVFARDEGAAAVRGQIVQQLALAAANALRAAESFEVRAADVGQDAVVGFGDRRQQGDFAAGAGAHFDHAEFGVAGHGEQRQRHADVVVEIAVRGIDFEAFGQHAAHQLLGRGLAVAARNGQNRNRQFAAVFARQLLKGFERIADEYRAVAADGRRIVHDDVCGAFGECVGGEAVAVEGRPVQGEEDGPRLDAARVGRDAGVPPENIVQFGHMDAVYAGCRPGCVRCVCLRCGI